MSLCHIIDRRKNGKNKNAVNRQRFLRRYKEQIRKAATDAIAERSVTDMTSGEKIGIPKRDISEPAFRHARDGKRESVHPGNKEFIAGDHIARPPGGNGSGTGKGKASKDGEGEDAFAFELSREEFLEFFFEDLELPNLNKSRLGMVMEYQTIRAGYSNDGVPANIDIVKSLQGALARRLAWQSPHRKSLREAEHEIEVLQEQDNPDQKALKDIEEKIKALRIRINAVPFLDTHDLRYRNHIKQPKPKTQAVMFCLMDVSGSMDQQRKEIAKRFFLLLYFFLNNTYEHTRVVFIRHHSVAKEVDEEEFFQARETGGTIVSSALQLMDEIITSRFPVSEWNIYGAQASDGDNWGTDSGLCAELLTQKILPKCQYYAYVQIAVEAEQGLWNEYEGVSEECDNFSMKKIVERTDIYPVFRQLMQKRAA
jgi:uncharacterized protein